MGISAYKEVTEWVSEFPVPNHTYLFDGKSNVLAYAPRGGQKIVILKTPLKLDNRRRKFVKVQHKALQSFAKTLQLKDETLQSEYPSWKVKSDSGKSYKVELIGGKYVCNCIGYSYRGTCKHSDQIKKEQK